MPKNVVICAFLFVDVFDTLGTLIGVSSKAGYLDKNGKLLAYNELAHAVKISDSGKYANNAVKNEKVNGAIETTLNIIESKNDKFSNEFQIVYENDKYEYNVSGSSLLRFLRDIYGRESPVIKEKGVCFVIFFELGWI